MSLPQPGHAQDIANLHFNILINNHNLAEYRDEIFAKITSYYDKELVEITADEMKHFLECVIYYYREGGADQPVECLNDHMVIHPYKGIDNKLHIADIANFYKFYGYIILSNKHNIIIPYRFFKTMYSLAKSCHNYRQQNGYFKLLSDDKLLKPFDITYPGLDPKFNARNVYNWYVSYVTRASLKRAMFHRYSLLNKHSASTQQHISLLGRTHFGDSDFKFSLICKILDGIGDLINTLYLAEYLTYYGRVEIIIIGYLAQKSGVHSEQHYRMDNIKIGEMTVDGFYGLINRDLRDYLKLEPEQRASFKPKYFLHAKNQSDFALAKAEIGKLPPIVQAKITTHYFESPEHLGKSYFINDLDGYINDDTPQILFGEILNADGRTVDNDKYYTLLKARRIKPQRFMQTPCQQQSSTYCNTKFQWHDDDCLSIFYGPRPGDVDMDITMFILNKIWNKKYIHITEYSKFNGIYNYITSWYLPTANSNLSNQTNQQLGNIVLFSSYRANKPGNRLTDRFPNIQEAYSTGLMPQSIGLTLRKKLLNLRPDPTLKEKFLADTGMKALGMKFFTCYSHDTLNEHPSIFAGLIRYYYDGPLLIKLNGINKVFDVDGIKQEGVLDFTGYSSRNTVPYYTVPGMPENVYVCKVFIEDLQLLYTVTEDIVGCTGDNSLTEVICLGKIPCYEIKQTKIEFFQSLILLAKSLGLDNYCGILQSSYSINEHFKVSASKSVDNYSVEISSKYKKLSQRVEAARKKYIYHILPESTVEKYLEEAQILKDFMIKNYDFRKAIDGIIFKELVLRPRGIDLNSVEISVAKNMENLLCGHPQLKQGPITDLPAEQRDELLDTIFEPIDRLRELTQR